MFVAEQTDLCFTWLYDSLINDMVYFVSTGGELATEDVQESADSSCYIIQFVSPEGLY